MMNSSWIRWVGAILTIAALLYVGAQLFRSSSEIAQNFANPLFLAATLGGGIVYALLALLIGSAWHLLLQSAAPSSLTFRQSIVIFGKSQFLKYLPTNLVHLAGRYALARAARVPHSAIALSTILEFALITAAALGLAVMLARPFLIHAVEDERLVDLLTIALIIGVAIAGAAGLVLVLFRKKVAGRALQRMIVASLAAVALYIVFFVLNGLLLEMIITALAGSGIGLQISVLGLVAAAWTAGFLVPGAPAGIGVREAALITGLQIIDASIPAVSVALAYRVATLLGDGLLAALSALADRRAEKPV